MVPSRVKAEPMKPAALAVAPPWRVPLLVPKIVLAFPSPGHQAIRPEGADEQLAAED